MTPEEQQAVDTWARFGRWHCDTWQRIAEQFSTLAAVRALDGNRNAAEFYASVGAQARARSKIGMNNVLAARAAAVACVIAGLLMLPVTLQVADAPGLPGGIPAPIQQVGC